MNKKTSLAGMDFAVLAVQLEKLRSIMKVEASSPEHDASVGDIAKAEGAAREGNESKILDYLKTAGKWALSCAEKLGTDIAAAALKVALGI